MGARLEKRAFARSFLTVLVLLTAAAVFFVSGSAAQEQGGQASPVQPGAGQTIVRPVPSPDSPAPPQSAQAAQAETKPPAEASSAQQPVEPVPAPLEQTAKAQDEQATQAQTPPQVPAPSAPSQLPGTAELQLSNSAPPPPKPEISPLREKTHSALMSANFTFYPIKALDPFAPFIAPETNSVGEEEPKTAPLTPLQRMSLGELEKGLKAITWGELGRKAVIEDSTGRGYIVGIGTPAGEHSGVISQISTDHLVIQQEIWDRKAKKRFPQEYTIKLSKKTDNKK